MRSQSAARTVVGGRWANPRRRLEVFVYSTCLFCHANLGQNVEIESFQVGRRPAFDAARGRLCVVCRECRNWNLSPLEQRWEAVEACERMYRDTVIRVSTDNIGLATLRHGLELVRVGKPLRPEFAAWRYGSRMRRRRLRGAGALAGSVLTSGAAIAVGRETSTATRARNAANNFRPCTVYMRTSPKIR